MNQQPIPDSQFAAPRRYPRFERWWYRVIVVVELVVAFNIACGLLGLFGTGPLSTATTRVAAPAVLITYQRITRASVQSEVIVETQGPLQGRTLEVLLPRAFGAAFEVVETSPPARDIHAEKEGIVYAFDFGVSHEGEARFSIKPRRAAIIDSLVKVGDGTAPLRQIIFP